MAAQGTAYSELSPGVAYGSGINTEYAPVPRGAGSDDFKDARATQYEVDNGKSLTPSTPPRFYAFWIDGWAPDAASLLLSLAALVALVITLYELDGRVVTSMPFDITINTIVAIISAVMKASLMLPVAEAMSQLKWKWFDRSKPLTDFEKFDSASRGPWGSFLLIIRLKARYLASLGAVITLLAIAIDPFTQQIIGPVGCTQIVYTDAASVLRINNITGIGSSQPGGNTNLDGKFITSIYIGLLGDPAPIQAQCSTGNCTFATDSASNVSYQSLGWESSCVDASSEIKTNDSIAGSPTYSIPIFGNWSSANETRMKMIGVDNPIRTMGGGYRGRGAYVDPSDNIDSYFPELWPEDKNLNSLFSFAVFYLKVNWGCLGDSSTGVNMTTCLAPAAAECKIWPTIQDIHSNVSTSVLQETVVSSEPLKFDKVSGEWLGLPSRIRSNGNWKACEPSTTFSADTPVPVANNSVLPVSTQPDFDDVRWYSEDCVWHIDMMSHRGLVTWLSDQFFFQKDLSAQTGGALAFNSSYLFGEEWLRPLYHDGEADMASIDAYAKKLTRSLTIDSRKLGAKQNFGAVSGTVTKQSVCNKVRWEWAAFPAAVFVLSLIFFASTVFYTRTGDSRGAWKSSSLATLFSGLDPDIRQHCGVLERKSEMESTAKVIRVQMRHTGDKWALAQ